MTKISLAHQPAGTTIKISSASPALFRRLIRRLKKAIPADQRTYLPSSKEWLIATAADPDLDAWLEGAEGLGAQIEALSVVAEPRQPEVAVMYFHHFGRRRPFETH
jgi:hypothetical protein